MHTETRIDNLDGLLEALEHVGEALLPNATQGLQSGLRTVERDAKKLCPVDTDELRSSIRATVQEYSSYAIGKVGTPKKHGAYVEMGTGEVGKESGGDGSGVPVHYRTGAWFVPLERGAVMMGDTEVEAASNGFMTRGQPARPFLYPAYKANRKKIVEAIRKAVKKGVKP